MKKNAQTVTAVIVISAFLLLTVTAETAILSLQCGVREDVLMDILAGIREADISTLCKIADGLEICVRELCPDEESYVVPVEKDILAKLIVISELKEMELEELIGTILENGIEEHGFYE